MQRWGGGSYTRKRKGKGGGNDPRCGCDMRVGWETSFGNRVQQGGGCGCGAVLPMTGGGSCGAPVIMERTLQGGSRKGRRGLLFSNGGGYDYSKDMIIDYFPKIPNMTELVYTGKGGKRQDIGRTLGNMRADVSSISNYAATQKGGKRQDIGRTLGNMRADVSSISNYAAMQKGGTCPVPDACPFPGTGYCEFYAKGGANYGEPMSLQAKLRGGYLVMNNNNNPNNNNARYNSVVWRRKIEDALEKIMRLLNQYPMLEPNQRISADLYYQFTNDFFARDVDILVYQRARNQNIINAIYQDRALDNIRSAYEQKLDEISNRLNQYSVASGIYPNSNNNNNNRQNIQAGGNYGEPMSLQAKLRGGYNSEEWRKKFLEAVDIIVQMLKDYPSPTSGENIDHAHEQLLRELYNPEFPKFNKIFPMIGMPPSITNEMRENASLYDIRNQYADKVQELLERLREYNIEIELNDRSSRGSISPPTRSDNEGQIGGGMNGCGCLTNPFIRGYTGSSLTGGKYKITRKNRNALKRHKAGKSIGFTMRSHLKAIGLLPRTSKKNYGKKIVSNKYK